MRDEKNTKGQLMLENRKLKDQLHDALKIPRTPKISYTWELYKTTAHVLPSKMVRTDDPFSIFYKEAKQL